LEHPPQHFVELGLVERLFNSAMGALVRVGIGPSHMRVLEVRGRKTGRLRSLPVDLLEDGGALFLVAPRGRTQWVRNAEAQGEVTLRRGRQPRGYRLRPLASPEKPRILKAYLDRFHREVQRYFPVRAGSSADAFVSLADRYPAFELVPKSRPARDSGSAG
jgi:deazaflavin-dependent oxidoreductase (nitroreductase family)